jgi:hypothetical protein
MPVSAQLSSASIENVSDLKQGLLYTVAYADLFDYPLRLEEIHRYLTYPASMEALSDLLSECESAVQEVGGYYVIRGREEIIPLRARREAVSLSLWKMTVRYGHIIAALPFVRMVAVTGSLALNNAGEEGDIDLMIVTAPGFLWTCRALTLLVARLARLEGAALCPNYLVSEESLLISERSHYVARELVQMIPFSGIEVYERIRRLNAWTREYLPNAAGAPTLPVRISTSRAPQRIQRILEAILRRLPLSLVERFEMQRKIRRLRREQAGSPEAYFSADVCKGHLDQHGGRIESELARRLRAFAAKGPLTPIEAEVEPDG